MSGKVLCYECYGSNEEKIVYYDNGFQSQRTCSKMSIISFYTSIKLFFMVSFTKSI